MPRKKKGKENLYEVVNKDKYTGRKNPRYLSSWELVFFERMDKNPNVIKWGSEVIIVPYFSHVDNKNRRYMVDIYVEYIKNGQSCIELIEIKPFAQTQPPKKGRKKKQTYLNELYTWEVNKAKWKAATKYANDRGWTFRIMTEKEIFR